MKEIKTYFPALTVKQQQQFEALQGLYEDWNAKINVISRKDIGNLTQHHLLHSLSIAKYISFTPGTRIMDVGTGGGFPGIPLAIFFPDVHFLLLDSIGKKIKVAEAVAKEIDLSNVEVIHARVEEEKRKFHFIVSRAVMPLPDLVRVTRKNIAADQLNAIPNGLICLKGGDLTAEIQPFKRMADEITLSTYFSEPFFHTKKLVYVSLS